MNPKTNWKLKARIEDIFVLQGNFADFLQCSESLVSRVVRGRHSLLKSERRRWAQALRSDVETLFGE